MGVLDGGDEFDRRRILEQVTARACAQGLENVEIVLVDGEHDDFSLGTTAPDLCRPFDARHARQTDVHEHDVGRVDLQGGEHLLAGSVGTVADQATGGPEQYGESLAYGTVVFYDDDVDHASLVERVNRRELDLFPSSQLTLQKSIEFEI